MKRRTTEEVNKRHFLNNYNAAHFSESGSNSKLIQERMHFLLARIEKHNAPNKCDDDYSVYTGSAGLCYLYLRLYEAANNNNDNNNNNNNDENNLNFTAGSQTIANKYLDTAFQYLEVALADVDREKRRHPRRERCVTFLCGDAGPFALAAVLHSMKGNTEKSNEYCEHLGKLFSTVESREALDSNELLYGRVGYLWALLFVQKYCGDAVVTRDLVVRVAKLILRIGEEFCHECPLMYKWHGKTYLGAAHGLSGILYVLMDVPELLQDQPIKNKIKQSTDFLFKLKFPSGNYPTRVDGTADELVQWCHGAPAIALLFVKAYKVFGEHKYLEGAVAAAEAVWEQGLLRKGLGVCHGVAGNAYCFLKLYEITKDEKFLRYNSHFCDFSMSNKGDSLLDTPDTPCSLFEGIGGTVCWYLDTLNGTARFPAYDL